MTENAVKNDIQHYMYIPA